MALKPAQWRAGDLRRNRRFSTRWRLRLRCARDLWVDAQIVDVSRGGISFVSPMRLRVGSMAELDVISSPRTFFRCRVRILREMRDGKDWKYGGTYDALQERDRRVLEECLDGLSDRPQVKAVLLAGVPESLDAAPM